MVMFRLVVNEFFLDIYDFENPFKSRTKEIKTFDPNYDNSSGFEIGYFYNIFLSV
jgi:hypothetical protein